MSLRDVEIDGTEVSPIPHKSNYFIVRRKNEAVSLFLSADTLEEKNNWVRNFEKTDCKVEIVIIILDPET